MSRFCLVNKIGPFLHDGIRDDDDEDVSVCYQGFFRRYDRGQGQVRVFPVLCYPVTYGREDPVHGSDFRGDLGPDSCLFSRLSSFSVKFLYLLEECQGSTRIR